MGRTICIDIDNLFDLLRSYGSGGPTPCEILGVAGDCTVQDIRAYASAYETREGIMVLDDLLDMWVACKAQAERTKLREMK